MRVHSERLSLGDDRVVLVRLAGELVVDTAPQVRHGLLKAIAEQPVLIVAEVSAMSVDDEVVLSVFPAVARHADAWPGIPIVLAAPDPALSAALDRSAVCRFVPVVGSVQEAIQAGDQHPPRRMVEHVTSGPHAVTTARALVTDACGRWGLAALSDVAELVVSELVSNAVRHAGGSIEVWVSLRRRYLHLSVRDHSSVPPRLGHGDGRGLMLVDALSVAWGSTATADGKVVWATLRHR